MVWHRWRSRCWCPSTLEPHSWLNISGIDWVWQNWICSICYRWDWDWIDGFLGGWRFWTGDTLRTMYRWEWTEESCWLRTTLEKVNVWGSYEWRRCIDEDIQWLLAKWTLRWFSFLLSLGDVGALLCVLLSDGMNREVLGLCLDQIGLSWSSCSRNVGGADAERSMMSQKTDESEYLAFCF